MQAGKCTRRENALTPFGCAVRLPFGDRSGTVRVPGPVRPGGGKMQAGKCTDPVRAPRSGTLTPFGQVGLWRRRWADSWQALIAIECRENHATLKRSIEQTLCDAPRSGTPCTFTAEQVTQILAVACESPELSGRPIDNWTHRELTAEVIKRQVVRSISISQVGCYLKEADLQPHRSKYWLNTKEKDQELFDQQVQIVCQTYQEAPVLHFQANTHTVSVDEMPGIQATERIEEKIPMQPGKPERIEYEYKRHGTLCLIGNWDVVTGQMIAPSIGTTRTEEDFLRHIFQYHPN